MKKWLSNTLTVVFSFVVLLAGTLFAYWILPVITGESEDLMMTSPIRLSNPQEILNTPRIPLYQEQCFPNLFAGRVKLGPSAIGEEETQARENFLTSFGESLDALFNLSIYGKILDKETEIWRYTDEKEAVGDPNGTRDLFAVDVLFTDARAKVWRITGCGYENAVLHLSCIEGLKDTETTPVFTIQRNIMPQEADDRLSSAVNNFSVKLASLPLFAGVIDMGIYEPLNVVFASAASNVAWAVTMESDGRYLVAGFLENSKTPFSYTFLDFSSEMRFGYYFPDQIERVSRSFAE